MKSTKSRTTTRTRRQFPGPKLPGETEKYMVEKNKNIGPRAASSKAVSLPSSCQGKAVVTTKVYPGPECSAEKRICPSTKMKLQLFPIDEATCVGLGKDGYHPYLELTLSARKKILSVLKRINDKWAGSRIARGEPVLYPYNVSEDSAGKKWTLSDVGVSAGDVFKAIGSPTVFRLRYGWFSNSETKSFGVPLASAVHEVCLEPQDVKKVGSATTESRCGETKRMEVASGDLEPGTSTEAVKVIEADKIPSNGLIELMGNETEKDVGVEQSSTLWDDGLTNISIGGLLSEISWQGMLNKCDPKSNGSNAGLQQSQLTCDSLDAFVAAHSNQSKGPRLPPPGSTSSILDAEDTCHAFALQKFSASVKDAPALNGSACSRTSSQDAETLNVTEIIIQSGLPKGLGGEVSETELSLGSRVYNHENSLGLSGIKWTDSLEPFDLGLSSSKKIVGGDSLSLGSIVR